MDGLLTSSHTCRCDAPVQYLMQVWVGNSVGYVPEICWYIIISSYMISMFVLIARRWRLHSLSLRPLGAGRKLLGILADKLEPLFGRAAALSIWELSQMWVSAFNSSRTIALRIASSTQSSLHCFRNWRRTAINLLGFGRSHSDRFRELP